MENHKMLKEICDKIGYNIEDYLCDKNKVINPFFNTREIIFTQEFVEKLAVYLFELYEEDMKKRDDAIFMIMRHLDNPVQYLYNLLGLGKQ